jgi:hypothetical protein
MKRTLTIRKILVGTLCALVVLTAGLAGVVSSAGAVRAAASYKAVFIIGWDGSPEYFANDFNTTAAWLANYGVTSYKFYTPNAKWSSVKSALEGANIVVYAGHGSGYEPGETEADQEYKNGFTLDPDASYNNVGDNWYRQNGIINRHILNTDVASLAPNALVIMTGACYSSGKSAEDDRSYTPAATLKNRIESYSATFIGLNGNYYAGPGTGLAPKEMLLKIFDGGKTLKQAAEEIAPYATYANSSACRDVSITGPYAHVNGGDNHTGGVVAGKMNLTASDILTGYVPPTPPPGPPTPPPPDPGMVKLSPNPGVGATNYSEYLLLSNPGAVDVVARVEFTKKSGNGYDNVTVPAAGRSTVNVNTYTAAGGEDVSVKVVAGAPIVAERAMYFNSNGRDGGSDAFGVPAPAKAWYFAEGYTAEQFDEWILVQNANAADAHVTLTCMRSDGYNKDVPMTVPAKSRCTVHVDSIAGFENAEVSARVESDVDVAAERAMYFNYHGYTDGAAEHGVQSPGKTWYLAEGYTAEQFDTYVLVQNTSDKTAKVDLEFQKEGGQVVPQSINVAAHSRYTVPVDKVPGMESCAFSTKVTSSEDTVVERSVFFDYKGKNGGTGAAAIANPSTEFYFAEGYTAEQFDTYLLLQNPGDHIADVQVTYIVDPSYGASVTRTYEVEPHSRYTVPVDNELPNAAFGITVQSMDAVPIIAERSMYFDYKGRNGGHAACGVPATSSVWYFAEGYTGW